MKIWRWYLVAGVAVVALAVGAVVVARAAIDDDADTGNGAAATATDNGQDSTGDDAVAGSFTMDDGSTASFADYRGRPLVVNFFASWCAPCLAEMPDFEQVHQDLADKVAFLGINLQDGVNDGRRVVELTGVTYEIARDPDGSIFSSFGGFAMPTTVFIDADGRVVDLHSGAIPADALRDRIDDVLS